MKKGFLLVMLFGAMMFVVASCGGGDSSATDGADTTHTEGDGHAH